LDKVRLANLVEFIYQNKNEGLYKFSDSQVRYRSANMSVTVFC